ncbi:MAG: hypothetical protein ABIG42_00235 [bacterium]
MKSMSSGLLLATLILLSMGCSGGNSDPVSGKIYIDPDSIGEIDILPIIAFDGSSAMGLLGAYSLEFSEDYSDVQLTPFRTSEVGESYVVSGMSYFVAKPCVDCLRIERITMDINGNVALGFWIKHPFPKGDPGLPPSAKNRLDLDLFDVSVVVVPRNATPTQYSNLQAGAYTDAILNAEGYTRDLSGVVGDNAAMPYKICFESSNKNRFEMGTDSQYFYLLFSKNGVSFTLYMTFAYGASAGYLTRLEPKYYVPEFNRKAAWKVKVTSATWYGNDPAEIKIDVYDWNHGGIVAGEFPDDVHTNYLKAGSDIESVTIDVPGMFNEIKEAVTNDHSTNGWDNPIRYTASFSNENGLLEGVYPGLVRVLDSRTPGAGLEGDSLIHTPDASNLEIYDLDEFATYQTFPVTIGPPCGPITGDVVTPTCPLIGVADDDLLDFTVIATSDNSGNPIALYEVDWDYDGVTFDVDASNNNGVFPGLGPFINPNCPAPNPVTYSVAFRATDSCLHPNTTIFATCEITVDTCCGPVTGEILSPDCPVTGASNHQTIAFEVSATSDNSGDPISEYQADWDYDGVTFDIDSTSPDGSFPDGGPFNNPNCPGTGEPGNVMVAFRATDSCDPPNTTIFATCDVTIDSCDNWTLTWGGTLMDEGGVLAKDSMGNIRATGYFSDVVDLDPGSGTDERVSKGETDIYLSKFSPNGVFQSTLTIGGVGVDVANNMFIDNSNNIFLTGYFSGTVDFNPGAGVEEKTSAGERDIFVLKLDSSGNFIWVAAWGGVGDDEGNDVAVNSSGRIFVTGYFKNTVDFNPGAGEDNRTSAGAFDFFASILDSNGNYINAITLGKFHYDEGEAIISDSSGNMIVAGGYGFNVDFDPGIGQAIHTAVGDLDIFVAKYDEDGNFIWVNTFGGPTYDRPYGIALDASDAIYLTGYFEVMVDFDPSGGTYELTSNGFSDAFLCGFDTDGNFGFAKGWGGTGIDSGFEVVLNDEFVFVTGSFASAVDFDPGAGTEDHSSHGDKDVFLSKFDFSTLDFTGARTWGGLERDEGWGITYDGDGDVYVTGGFGGTVDFDPGVWPDEHVSNGETDAFLTKISP